MIFLQRGDDSECLFVQDPGTIDGNPANQVRLVVYPNIYRALYIPGGEGFLLSTVVPKI